MKLQKLTIHNIASIEDAEIDFDKEPLAGSDVFLITGDTGSGKSTILDAICLALYADTPRLDNTKMQGGASDENGSTIDVDDPRQLLRRNTGEGFVELTFTTVKDNKDVHYKARWAVHRKDDNPAESFPKQRAKKNWTLTNIDTGVTAEGPTAVREIMADAVELTFDQFCRTTMLAQGEFTRFLNSNNEEKAAILEKITGTDKYKKIGKKIHEITAEKERLWKDATKDVGQITLLSDEDIAKKQGQITACDSRYNELKTDSNNASKKLQWFTEDKNLKEKVTNAEQECTKAKQAVETDEFKEKDLLVTQWNATIEARSWLTAQQKAKNEKTQQSEKLEGLKADYLMVLAGQAFEEQKRQQTEQKLNDLPQVEANEEETANDTLKALRKKLDNAKGLKNKIKIAKDKIETLESEKQRRQQASAKLAQTLQDIEGKKQAAAALNLPIEEALKIKKDREEVYEKQKDTIDNFAKLMRQKLHVGDTCPVCRHTVTDELPHEEELAKLVGDLSQTFNEAKGKYDGLVEEKNKLLAEKKAFEESYARDKAAFDNDTSVSTASQRALQACKDCGIEVFDENTTPQQLKTLEAKTADEIQQLEEKDLPKWEMKVSAYINTTKKRGRLTGELGVIQAALKTVKKAVEAILKDWPEWKELHPVAAAEVQKLSEKASEVRTKVNTAVTILGTATTTAADNQFHLDQFFTGHPEISHDRLVALNAIKLADITTLTKEVNDARTAVSSKKEAAKQANENYDEHLATKPEMKEEDNFEKLTSFVKEKEEEMKKVNTEKGGIERDLETNDKNVEKHGDLLKKKELLEADFNKWDRFRDFLGDGEGKKFNKIAQSYILGSLIHSANHYMHNFYDRYTLKVVPGTFVIMIEDAYQGYASRAASTISGGESFLVSLALALALSDIGDKLAVDTLFIDEGFGTLSGAPLQNAIDTLRKLHSQSGRHVGIISHIEELRESIPTQIQVIQSAQTGSSHIEIYPDSIR